MKKQILKKIKHGTLVRIDADGKDYVRTRAINGRVFLQDASVDMRIATTIPGVHLPTETEVFVVEE